jgi:hypothetical protein
VVVFFSRSYFTHWNHNYPWDFPRPVFKVITIQQTGAILQEGEWLFLIEEFNKKLKPFISVIHNLKNILLFRRGILKKILFKCVILASVFMMVIGCSNSGVPSVKGNAKSKTTSTSKENGKVSTTEKDYEKTIQTFLKLELTGPNKEFKKALEQVDTTGNPTLLNAYNKKYYQPLLAKDYYQDFINAKYEIFWLMAAYKEGYQLKAKNIEIKKGDGSYDWKAKVEYTKDGKTQTSTINGLINLNENGRIIYVRFTPDDDGIWKLWKDYNQP